MDHPAYYHGAEQVDQAQQHAQQFPLHDPSSYGAGPNSADEIDAAQNPDLSGHVDTNGLETPAAAAARKEKKKRASKACNACRKRKVKCDSSVVPCLQCQEHDIPCQFTCPTRKRGPPNAYVEAQKAKLVRYGSFQAQSPNFGASAGRAGPDLGLEELAVPEVLNRIFNDFFRYLFPVAPVLVESHFRQNLSNQTLYTNDFLALCASILALTIACLKSNHEFYGFVSVDSCQAFALIRLGIGYRDRVSVSLAATLLYLSMSSSSSPKLPITENTRAAMFRAEFTTAVQFLVDTQLRRGVMNFLDEQMLKRMYSYMSYLNISLAMQGFQSLISMCKHNPIVGAEDKDMQPLDVDLEQFALAGSTHEDRSSGSGARSYVPGIVTCSKLYRLYAESHHIRSDENLSSAVRFTSVCATLENMNVCLEDGPLQLQWTDLTQMHGPGFEAQRVNVIISKLHLTSLLMEECRMLTPKLDLSELSPSAVMRTRTLEVERRAVITEALHVICTVSRTALEANGQSMVGRVRQIASTLTDIIQSQSEGSAIKEKEELSRFAEILSELDPAQPHDQLAGPTLTAGAEDEWRRFKNDLTAETA